MFVVAYWPNYNKVLINWVQVHSSQYFTEKLFDCKIPQTVNGSSTCQVFVLWHKSYLHLVSKFVCIVQNCSCLKWFIYSWLCDLEDQKLVLILVGFVLVLIIKFLSLPICRLLLLFIYLSFCIRVLLSICFSTYRFFYKYLRLHLV